MEVTYSTVTLGVLILLLKFMRLVRRSMGDKMTPVATNRQPLLRHAIVRTTKGSRP